MYTQTKQGVRCKEPILVRTTLKSQTYSIETNQKNPISNLDVSFCFLFSTVENFETKKKRELKIKIRKTSIKHLIFNFYNCCRY